MNAPLVSIVTPTYNRKHLLADAIESVMAQTFQDYEHIIVDDGSKDGTADFVQERYRNKIVFVRQENQGISAARNRGISLARGKYIAFLDSDDKWHPEKLKKQVEYMEAHPEMGMLCARFRAYEIGKEEELRFGPDDFSDKFEDLLNSRNFIPTSTVMVRKACLDAVGVFDTAINCYEDFDLWLRLAKNYKYTCLSEELAVYREHPHNIGKDMSNTHTGLWKVYSKMIALYGSEIPKNSLIRRKAAAYEYLVGTDFIRKHQWKAGFERISHALKADWTLGSYFAGHSRPSFMIVKPHIVFFCSFFGLLFWGDRTDSIKQKL